MLSKCKKVVSGVKNDSDEQCGRRHSRRRRRNPSDGRHRLIVIVRRTETTAGRGLVSSARLRLLLAGHDAPPMQPNDHSRGKLSLILRPSVRFFALL